MTYLALIATGDTPTAIALELWLDLEKFVQDRNYEAIDLVFDESIGVSFFYRGDSRLKLGVKVLFQVKKTFCGYHGHFMR